MYALSKIRNAVWVLVALAMWVPRSAAQLEIGDNLQMNMNGSLGFGYGGSFGDPGASSHSLSMTGSGTMLGSYYDPNFVSFTVQPYYDRNQSNSASQSIFNESGVTASANFFGGSHFPGYVGYGRNFNSSGSGESSGGSLVRHRTPRGKAERIFQPLFFGLVHNAHRRCRRTIHESRAIG